MTARTTRKMQVPAYWPFKVRVQPSEKRGVLKDVKNVIDISDMDMLISIDDPVEVAMDFPVFVAAIVIAIPVVVDLVILDISMFIIVATAG